MILHPVIIVPKLIVLAIIIVVLAILYPILTSEQFFIAVLISILFFGVFLAVFWTALLRFMRNPESKLTKAIILTESQRREFGYHAGSSEYQSLMHNKGNALSPLRPSGTAYIAGKRVTVQTLGDYLPAGSQIEVVAVEGSRIIVKQIEDNHPKT